MVDSACYRIIGEYLEAGKRGGVVSHESLHSLSFGPWPTIGPALWISISIQVRQPEHRHEYTKATGVSAEAIGVCVRSMRATAATNALSHEADIGKMQNGWMTRTYPPLGSTTGAR